MFSEFLLMFFSSSLSKRNDLVNEYILCYQSIFLNFQRLGVVLKPQLTLAVIIVLIILYSFVLYCNRNFLRTRLPRELPLLRIREE